jgi:hypothetical protein
MAEAEKALGAVSSVALQDCADILYSTYSRTHSFLMLYEHLLLQEACSLLVAMSFGRYNVAMSVVLRKARRFP